MIRAQCGFQCIHTHGFAGVKLLPQGQPRSAHSLCCLWLSVSHISLLPAAFLLGFASQGIQEADRQAEGGKRDTFLPVCFLSFVMILWQLFCTPLA